MKKFFAYTIGWLISGIILFPCLVMSMLTGMRYDFHFMFHLWYQVNFLNFDKRFHHIHYEYYFDKPTLFTCRDEENERYTFVLLDDDEDTYIGIPLTQEQLIDFTMGRIDLRTLFMRNMSRRRRGNFYIGKFNQDATFTARLYGGKIKEEMMPANGLVII